MPTIKREWSEIAKDVITDAQNSLQEIGKRDRFDIGRLGKSEPATSGLLT
jgi:hypothetical protein